jgi:hypothetical protein
MENKDDPAAKPDDNAGSKAKQPHRWRPGEWPMGHFYRRLWRTLLLRQLWADQIIPQWIFAKSTIHDDLSGKRTESVRKAD